MAPFCTAGKVHVGLDESFSLGRHPLSAAEIAEVGPRGPFRPLRAAALPRGAPAAGCGSGSGPTCWPSSPRPSAHLPPGIIAYDWYYYPFGRRPRIELRNFAEYDLAPALRARGDRILGLPDERLLPPRAPSRVRREAREHPRLVAPVPAVGAAGLLVTSWEPSRLAIEMTTVVDAAAACLWLDPEIETIPGMLAGGFERVFGGTRGRERARPALACDERAFAGYARWEINDRWDGCAPTRGVAGSRPSGAFFGRLGAAIRRFPSPSLAASPSGATWPSATSTCARRPRRLALRRRLARRGPGRPPGSRSGWRGCSRHADEFAATAKAGRRAARDLWRLTRDRRVRGPTSASSLSIPSGSAPFGAGSRAASPIRAAVCRASPVCGAWQLRFDVCTTLRARAPEGGRRAACRPDGAWHELDSRHARVPRPRPPVPGPRSAGSSRVPVDSPGAALRIAMRGIGQVAVSRVEVTDGLQTSAATGAGRGGSSSAPGRPGGDFPTSTGRATPGSCGSPSRPDPGDRPVRARRKKWPGQAAGPCLRSMFRACALEAVLAVDVEHPADGAVVGANVRIGVRERVDGGGGCMLATLLQPSVTFRPSSHLLACAGG
jgi:hypothetical protein